MKLSFYLCAALLVTTPLATFARPKRMGPSAIQAARLKQNPPPNYLAHYLPDDRYKIAGGVWKYVSTDLDTYYHLPSSPNMLRQPASRVIGFANAKDAEEAGYEPDPTDGTAQKAQLSTDSSKYTFGGVDGSGFTEAENQYRKQLADSVDDFWRAADKFFDRLQRFNRQSNSTTFLVGARPYTKEYVALTRGWLARVNALKPPPRFAGVHRLMRDGTAKIALGANYFDEAARTNNMSLFDKGIAVAAQSRNSTEKAVAMMKALKR